MAQLQLLRDAINSMDGGRPFIVKVHFNFEDHEDQTWAFPYWLQLVQGFDRDSTINMVSEDAVRGYWYWQ